MTLFCFIMKKSVEEEKNIYFPLDFEKIEKNYGDTEGVIFSKKIQALMAKIYRILYIFAAE